MDKKESDIRVDICFELSKNRLRSRLNYSASEIDALAEILRGLAMPCGTRIEDNNTRLRPQITVESDTLDDAFASAAAHHFRHLIEVGTPAFEDFESKRNVAQSV